ncbi:MAG: hypothetical protein QXI22_01280 [Sulfolobales archaeon]
MIHGFGVPRNSLVVSRSRDSMVDGLAGWNLFEVDKPIARSLAILLLSVIAPYHITPYGGANIYLELYI